MRPAGRCQAQQGPGWQRRVGDAACLPTFVPVGEVSGTFCAPKLDDSSINERPPRHLKVIALAPQATLVGTELLKKLQSFFGSFLTYLWFPLHLPFGHPLL